VFTVPPTLQSFGEVVAQKFERPESRALPTFGSAEAGNATPKAAFRSLELAVPTRSGPSSKTRAAIHLLSLTHAVRIASFCRRSGERCELHHRSDAAFNEAVAP